MSEQADNGHKWDLKGGAYTKNRPSMGFGMALWQCRRCNIAASRALTAQNEKLNSIVQPPDIDEPCISRGETDV